MGIVLFTLISQTASADESSLLSKIFFDPIVKDTLLADIDSKSVWDGVEIYLRVLKHRQTFDTWDQWLQDIKKQTELEGPEVESGAGFSTDVLQAKALLLDAMRARAFAAGEFQKAGAEYFQVFGRYPPTDKSPEGLLPPIDLLPGNAEDARKMAAQKANEAGRSPVDAELASDQALAYLEAAQVQVDLAKNAKDLSRKFLDLAEEERAAGRRGLLNVLSTKNQLIKTTVSFQSLEVDYVSAVFNLLHLIGRLDAQTIIRSKSGPNGIGPGNPLPRDSEDSTDGAVKSSQNAGVDPGGIKPKVPAPTPPKVTVVPEPRPNGEPIAKIVMSIGNAWVTGTSRDKVKANIGDAVYAEDSIEVGLSGELGLEFADGSAFAFSQNTDFTIDRFDYDPREQTGAFALTIREGKFSILSGSIAKTGPEGMRIKTPVATVLVRGTAMAGSVYGLTGISEFALIPEGSFTGEIVVSNKGGSVVLNQAWSLTTVRSAEKAPPPPRTEQRQRIMEHFGDILDFILDALGKPEYAPGQQGAFDLENQRNGSNALVADWRPPMNAWKHGLGPKPTGRPPDTIKSSSLPSAMRASRVFAGPKQYPPTSFAAYGVVAFPWRATPSTRDRYLMLCHAYVAGLPHRTELKIPKSFQMATVWPMETDEVATKTNRAPRRDVCPPAVDRYGMTISDKAIRDAQLVGADTSGRGPFLLAWSPPDRKGNKDALVLVWDLSDVTTSEQATQAFKFWAKEIESEPQLWNRGWNLERVRLKISFWLDRYGDTVISLFGASKD